MGTWIKGDKIATLRKQKSMDQTELAQAAGIAQSVISRMERNLQVDYKVSVVISIARALGVSVDSLLNESTSVSDLEPELQSILTELSQREQRTQLIAARTLRGLLDGLDE